MQDSNFEYASWEADDISYAAELNTDDLPPPPQRYTRFSPSAPKSGGRSWESLRKAWATRNRKKWEINKEFFIANVLPLIREKLNARAFLHLSSALEMRELATAGGWDFYTAPDGRGGWLHQSDIESIKRGGEIGAVKSEPPANT